MVAALERTGWFKLADVPCIYDPDQIRTFYSAITIVEIGRASCRERV